MTAVDHVTYSVTHGPAPPRSTRLTSRSSPGNSSALERERETSNENTLQQQIILEKTHIYSSAPVKHTHTQNKHSSIVIKRPGAYNYSHRLAYVLHLEGITGYPVLMVKLQPSAPISAKT